MRERLAMRLFARLNLPAPREAHARVFVNGAYLGLYVIVESIDKDFIERVYKPRVSDTTDTERDGYLYEYRWNYPFYFSDLGPDLQPYADLFEPRTHETRAARSAVRTDPRPDARHPDRLRTRLRSRRVPVDRPRPVRALRGGRELPGRFRRHAGRLGHEQLLSVPASEASGVAQVIAWDRDNAFSAADHPIWFNTEENVLMRRAMAVPALRARYLDTLEACARLATEPGDDPRGWLEREIDFVVGQIREAVVADRARPHDTEAFDREVAHVRQFAQWRPAYVLCEVARERGSGAARCDPGR